MKYVAVIDIGKTNAKLALVDLSSRSEIAVLTRPNTVINAAPYPHFDTDGIWAFVKSGLAQFQADQCIDGISVTTHGACAAFLAADGTLAAPVLDYEHTGPDETRTAYDLVRPPFSQTGCPALPNGLNLGAQFFWQLHQDEGLRGRTAQIVTWPQYWGFRLTGQSATDLCSLGCHTDLWNPFAGSWSSLVDALDLRQVLAPARKPSYRLGTVLPALQAELGLGAVPVLTGIHDSNASLVPYLGDAQPFSVVSTGTWVVCMAMGGEARNLDPSRDTLVNVNALGQVVPSARFMGGREYETVRQNAPAIATQLDADRVLARKLMLLPSVVADCGPFPHHQMSWSAQDRSIAETEVALGYYLALMTAACLRNIGADGPTCIEGPFSVNPWYRAMLAAATGRSVVASPSRTGTAVGAALLFDGLAREGFAPERAVPPAPGLVAYASAWVRAVECTYA